MDAERKRQAFEAFKKAWEEYPSQDNEGYIPDRGGFKCGWFSALHWADSTPPPQEGDEEAANKYWREHRDFHDSDGVDVCQVFKDGAAHARRTQNAEVERLKSCFKADMENWSKVDDERLAQISELRTLLERAKKFAEHYAHTASDSDEGDFRVREANNFIKGYERMKGKQ